VKVWPGGYVLKQQTVSATRGGVSSQGCCWHELLAAFLSAIDAIEFTARTGYGY
jgi:hypothetical protein